MTRPSPLLAALLAAGLQGVPGPAKAAPAPRVAVVVGNASYPGLPALPACAASARAVADALATLGFDVVRAQDARGVDSGAQLAALDARLRAAAPPGAAAPVPGATVIVYLCGHARSVDGRRFLLPVDAGTDRPDDLLAQGVLPRSFVRVASAAGASGGVLLLDAFAVPGTTGAEGRAGPAADAAGGPFGLAIATHPAPPTGAASRATPLATAAVSALARPGADTGTLVAAIRAGAAASDGATLAVSAPSAPAPLAPAMPAQPAAPPPAAVASADAVPAAVPAPPAPAGAGQGDTPDVATQAGRRAVQQALVRLGYYAGPLDGVFGPDTTAAIRRLQHELGAPLTGSLSPAESAALQVRAR